MTDTHYTGSAYIGVVGPDEIPVDSVLSIMNIERRKGDATPLFMKATKGYEARQKHVDAFLVSQHDWLLLLDHDMIFEPDTLERLRSHGVPYVSGLYMRRRFAPMFSVWFEPFTGEWPLMPFTADPERGRLHELGASGWGCVLLHREVIEGTRPYLDGYQEVLEDAMYDLRGEKDIIGSDIR